MQPNLSLPKIDKAWTLFLDRDGVLNTRLPHQYVRSWHEFVFEPKVTDALRIAHALFGRIVVVTNQQGIAKGLMTAADLHAIHQLMLAAVTAAGGRIDKIYHCPALKTDPRNCRKPRPDMAHQAAADFPEIDFKRSVMVGDSATDIAFGDSLQMFCVLVETNQDELRAQHPALAKAACRCPSLFHFLQEVTTESSNRSY